MTALCRWTLENIDTGGSAIQADKILMGRHEDWEQEYNTFDRLRRLTEEPRRKIKHIQEADKPPRTANQRPELSDKDSNQAI